LGAFLKRFFCGATEGSDHAISCIELLEDWNVRRPEDIAVVKALGEGLHLSGRVKVARAWYEVVLERFPNDASTLNNMANLLHAEGGGSTSSNLCERHHGIPILLTYNHAS